MGQWALGPMAFVSATTMAVLAVDVMTGSRLQLSSLMGLQPVVGGRYYGMGNPTFALFATATILLCTAVSSMLVLAGRRRAAALAVVLIGGFAVVVDAMPFWGRRRRRAARAAPRAGLPRARGARPQDDLEAAAPAWRGVVGLFFLGGGRGLAAPGVLANPPGPVRAGDHRRQRARHRHPQGRSRTSSILLGNAPLTLLVPAALLFVIYVLARPTSWGSRAMQRSYDQAPTLRAGLIALLITLTIGFLINDSGVAIPAVGAHPRGTAHRVGVGVVPARRGASRRPDPLRTPAAMTTHPQHEPHPRHDAAPHPQGEVLDGRGQAEHPPRHVGDGQRDQAHQRDEVDQARAAPPGARTRPAGRTRAASRARRASRPGPGTR